MIARLEVREYKTESEETVPPGFAYSYFVDPETGKYYRPKPSYFVTGEDLSTLFEEIPER